jgi:TadE-like protein
MKRQRAQSLVEFALVFPIFLLLTFGLLDLGRAVWHYNTLADAARQAARQRELGVMSPSLNFCNAMFTEPCVLTTVVPPPPPPLDTVQIALAPCPTPSVAARYTFQPIFAFLGNFPWVETATPGTGILLSATSAVPLVPGVC